MVGAQYCLFTMNSQADELPFYIGTFTDNKSTSEGIYQGTLDTETGKLGPITLAAKTESPSWVTLSLDKKTLYVGNEIKGTGTVEAYQRAADGSLTLLNSTSSSGAGPCYVSLDEGRQNLLVANYNNGIIASIHLENNGSLGKVVSVIQLTGSGPDLSRQKSSHAHFIEARGTNVYACDLGSDRIWEYDLKPSGELGPHDPPFAQVPPGAGVRHLAIDRAGRFVYSSNEMGNSVSVFTRKSTGELKCMQTLSSMASGHPEKGTTTAEIALHPSGKWLYVSNRGCETVTVFKVGTDGLLTMQQIVPSPAKFPRGFGIDPSGKWLVMAGQMDDRLAVLKIGDDGSLSATGVSAQVGRPTCVAF